MSSAAALGRDIGIMQHHPIAYVQAVALLQPLVHEVKNILWCRLSQGNEVGGGETWILRNATPEEMRTYLLVRLLGPRRRKAGHATNQELACGERAMSVRRQRLDPRRARNGSKLASGGKGGGGVLRGRHILQEAWTRKSENGAAVGNEFLAQL